MAIQKGTGFTNLNRILQANRGNKLGQTVSGGIQGQVQGVQSNVKSAQDQFEEEAQKNRLDTPEAIAKRQGVLGRFDESNYTPDMNKFSVSSGVEDNYSASKSQFEQDKAAKQKEFEDQQANYTSKQTNIADLRAQLAKTPQYIIRKPIDLSGLTGIPYKPNQKIKTENPEYNKLKKQIVGLAGSVGSAPVNQADSLSFDEAQGKYDKAVEAEKAQFQKTERERLVAANLPSEQEIKDFSKYRTGTYSGPRELQDYTTLLGKAQQAESLGDLTRSEGGRQELLRRFVGGTNYTQGQRQLDTTLLGQQPGALGAVSRQARGAEELVSRAGEQASGLAQEFVGRARQFGDETTKQLGETKAPVSSELDKRVQEAQAAEEARLSNLKAVQDALIGDSENFKGLDSWARTGLALQEAANKGILGDQDVAMLLGRDNKVGLLQRGANLGLDINKLLNERFTNQLAQNVGRTGIASEEEIARLNALDKLSGKQGSDLEFLPSLGKFSAGKTGLDIKSLQDYIAKAEAERAKTDKGFSDRLAQEQAGYLDMAKLGAMNVAGGAMQAGSSALNQVLNPQSFYDPGTIGQNVSGGLQGVVGASAGLQNLQGQGGAAILEGLAKLKVGDKSLADTEGGRQLLDAINLYSQYTSGVGDVMNTGAAGIGGAIKNLSSGNIGGAVSNITKTPGNVIKSAGGTVKKTAKKVKEKVKKLFSDEMLKTNIEYDSKDVQKFMDRIKPSAYNYKDEVKDSPLASKNRELGVMAQDLEKSKLGKESVQDTDKGKVVDYDNLEPKMLASIAALNKRLKELENKK